MNVDMGLLFWSLMFVVIASVIIMYACDTFEGASTYLGRNMAPGVKGATINAIGSSMPELLTTAVFLFVYRDIDGFSAGVATAAGSAIFNGLIIPALCIIVVTTMGARVNGKMTKVSAIELDPKTIIRDGFWLLVSEAVLIYFLGDTILTWVTGTFLLLCYVGYFTHLMWYNKKYGGNNDDDEEEEEAEGEKSFLKGVLKFDFNYPYIQGQSLYHRFRCGCTEWGYRCIGCRLPVIGQGGHNGCRRASDSNLFYSRSAGCRGDQRSGHDLVVEGRSQRQLR